MIVALDDAEELMVFESLEQVNVHCETIDVGNGIYEFWNDQAQRLKPMLPPPRPRRRWWSFWSSTPEIIGLEPDGAPDPGGFVGFLHRAKYLATEPKSQFATLAQAKADLTRRVQRTAG